MVKAKLKDIKKELEQQQAEVYGETSISGSSPDPESDDDVEKAVGEVTGDLPEGRDSFNIAEEVEKDERARRTKPNEDED